MIIVLFRLDSGLSCAVPIPAVDLVFYPLIFTERFMLLGLNSGHALILFVGSEDFIGFLTVCYVFM